eukprot:10404477-Karenia_brevis.AAC.1
MAPVDTAVTCTTGSGSLLDYALGSASIQWLLSPVRSTPTPWGPHDGFYVDVVRSVPDVFIKIQ